MDVISQEGGFNATEEGVQDDPYREQKAACCRRHSCQGTGHSRATYDLSMGSQSDEYT